LSVQVSGDDSTGPAQIKRTEPRQDRKVAAVGTIFIVPQGRLTGAGCLEHDESVRLSIPGAQPFSFMIFLRILHYGF